MLNMCVRATPYIGWVRVGLGLGFTGKLGCACNGAWVVVHWCMIGGGDVVMW